MPGTTRRSTAGPVRVSADEAGFMLVEVIVSAVLLLILALGTLSLIDGSQNTSAQQRSKGIASNLGHQALNRIRQSKFTTATNFTTTATPVPIDGRSYTVTTTGVWSSAIGSTTTCTTSTSGNPGQYLTVTSSVTWTGMGKVAPVTANTLITPRPGEVSTTTGTYMITVQTAAGVPLAGATVTMNGTTLATSAAGCVAFTGLAPGTYTTSYAKTGGYVATTGSGTGYYDAVVTKGNASSKTVQLDLAAKITPVNFKRDDGTTPNPTWNSYSFSSNQGADFLKDYPGTVYAPSLTNSATLFPFVGGYQVYSGTCVGNNPTFYMSTFGTTFPESAVAPGAGATVAATAYLSKVTIKVTGVTKTTTIGSNLYPTTSTALMASCTEAAGPRVSVTNNGSAVTGNPSVAITNSPASGSGDVTFTDDLPYGTWTYCVDNGSKYRLFKSYVNTPTGGTTSVTVVGSTLSTGTSGTCADNATMKTAAA
jgi:Tfp pilus assembly protein PilV